MIMEIFLVLVLIIVIISLVGKFYSGGKKGGMVSRMFRPYPMLIDLNIPIKKGKIAGRYGIEPIGDSNESMVRYKRGMREYSEPEIVPNSAILTIDPPYTDLEGGITFILPYKPNNIMQIVEQKYVMEMILQQKIINQLQKQTFLLTQEIKSGTSNTIILDRIKSLNNAIQELTKTRYPEKEPTTTLEVPTTKEKTMMPRTF